MANQTGNKVARPATTKVVSPTDKKSVGGKGGNNPPPKPPSGW